MCGIYVHGTRLDSHRLPNTSLTNTQALAQPRINSSLPASPNCLCTNKPLEMFYTSPQSHLSRSKRSNRLALIPSSLIPLIPTDSLLKAGQLPTAKPNSTHILLLQIVCAATPSTPALSTPPQRQLQHQEVPKMAHIKRSPQFRRCESTHQY